MKTDLTDAELLDYIEENQADLVFFRLDEGWYVNLRNGEFKSTHIRPTARSAIIDAYNNIFDED